MLFLSHDTKDRCVGVFSCKAASDRTPTESSTTSLNGLEQVWLLPSSCHVACTFAKFRFLGGTSVPRLATGLYMYRETVMRRRANVSTLYSLFNIGLLYCLVWNSLANGSNFLPCFLYVQWLDFEIVFVKWKYISVMLHDESFVL